MRAVRSSVPWRSIPALLATLLGQPGSAVAETSAVGMLPAGHPVPEADTAGLVQPHAVGSISAPVQGLVAPSLMLAEVYRPGIAVADYWVSEKLDGVRAFWDGAHLISRGGHRVRVPAWFLAGFPLESLDGELWMGRGRFETLSGTVRRLEPVDTDWREVHFMAFDLPGLAAPFGERLSRLQGLVVASGNPRLSVLEQVRVADHEALMAMLARVARAGGEGLMLHRDAAWYRGGRTPDLLKLKPYEDAEALVVAHVPGKGRFQGMLGALEVVEGTGRHFRIGTGFTDSLRRNPPPIGSRVTFKYQGRTAEGIPRFASFLRVDPEPSQ